MKMDMEWALEIANEHREDIANGVSISPTSLAIVMLADFTLSAREKKVTM